MNRANDVLPRRVLVVDGSLLHPDTAHGRAINGLVEEFARRGVTVITSVSFEDGEAVVTSPRCRRPGSHPARHTSDWCAARSNSCHSDSWRGGR
jgi:hypothetical protein